MKLKKITKILKIKYKNRRNKAEGTKRWHIITQIFDKKRDQKFDGNLEDNSKYWLIVELILTI